MIKKAIPLIAASLIMAAVGVFTPAAAARETDSLDFSLSAKSAILMEASTGLVLYEKDADTPRPIASTTKLMTALIVLENAGLDEVVSITPESVGVEGTSMDLQAGDTLTVRELLYGLMLESGNDAAVALAVHTAGSVEKFVALMNERASGLGLSNTHYVNPHGLTAEGHESSARDLARLMAICMENPVFAQIASTRTMSCGDRLFKNHNKLMWSYEGMAAGKTGYTKAAGRTLVTCAQRDGLRLICVTLNDGDDWEEHTRMYDAAFERWEMRTCVFAGEVVAHVPVIAGTAGSVGAAASRSIKVLVRRGEETETRAVTPDFLYAQVRAGDRVGFVEILRDGEVIGTVELVAVGDVEREKGRTEGPFEWLKRRIEWKKGSRS